MVVDKDERYTYIQGSLKTVVFRCANPYGQKQKTFMATTVVRGRS